MSLRYLSVCSGIEAASAAWHGLGFEPVAFSEIEPFPCRVLAQHFPRVPNLGDMTKFQEWPHLAIDLLVGGTPCQSFSVAGLRKGLADPRGNLMLTWLAIADRYRPQWLVWENVPGVLSSNGGRDFGALLGGLAELGYGFAYRVLDAQYVRVDSHPRAVPQRRRRVFVVGHSGGQWQRAAAVLLERESLQGNPPPRRKAGQGVAPTIASRPTGGGGLGTDFDCDGGLVASTGSVSHCLNGGGMGRIDYETETLIAHALRGEGHDASDDGAAYTVEARSEVQAVAFDMRGRDGGAQMEGPHDTANLRAADGGSSRSYVATSWSVRRLTPTECERLQGFPAGWTDVPHKGKPAADGPRYKALGNSMAVNVMRWIGQRIQQVATIATRPTMEE